MQLIGTGEGWGPVILSASEGSLAVTPRFRLFPETWPLLLHFISPQGIAVAPASRPVGVSGTAKMAVLRQRPLSQTSQRSMSPPPANKVIPRFIYCLMDRQGGANPAD